MVRRQGVEVEEGVLCGPSDTDREWQFIGRNDSRMCDLRSECRVPHDELPCPGMRNLTARQLQEQGGAAVDQGVFCIILETDIWETIGQEDNKTCDLQCDCRGCWDEASCPGFNVTGDLIHSQMGAAAEEGVICETHVGRNWEVTGRKDTRICDLLCDCSGCHDEASCPWSAGVSREHLLTQEDRYSGLVGVLATTFHLNKQVTTQYSR